MLKVLRLHFNDIYSSKHIKSSELAIIHRTIDDHEDAELKKQCVCKRKFLEKRPSFGSNHEGNTNICGDSGGDNSVNIDGAGIKYSDNSSDTNCSNNDGSFINGSSNDNRNKVNYKPKLNTERKKNGGVYSRKIVDSNDDTVVERHKLERKKRSEWDVKEKDNKNNNNAKKILSKRAKTPSTTESETFKRLTKHKSVRDYEAILTGLWRLLLIIMFVCYKLLIFII
jgi:hypothetical protein